MPRLSTIPPTVPTVFSYRKRTISPASARSRRCAAASHEIVSEPADLSPDLARDVPQDLQPIQRAAIAFR